MIRVCWAQWLRRWMGVARGAAILLLLLTALAGCGPTVGQPHMVPEAILAEPLVTEPWSFGIQPGVLIKTEHYRIYTTIRDPLYQRLLAKVLEADLAHFAVPNSPRLEPMVCYVFGDRRNWELYTRRHGGEAAQIYLAISAGGYSYRGQFVGYDIGLEPTLSVIAHEAWHQYSWFVFRGGLPSWLEEGLATQNEGIEWDGTVPQFSAARNWHRFRTLKEALRENRALKIADLTTLDAGQAVNKNDPKYIDAFYAGVWSFTLFLQQGPYKARLEAALAQAREGKLHQALLPPGVRLPPQTLEWNRAAGPALVRLLEPDTAKLEREYEAFLRRLTEKWPPELPAK